MQPQTGRASALAHRLRALREEHWPDRRLTQRQLGQAIGGISPPLISSWENPHSEKVPPNPRLAAYATFFATRRSVEQEPFRLLDPTELAPDEQTNRETLLNELTELRELALEVPQPTSPPHIHMTEQHGLWHFPVLEEITIVCADLPDHLRQAIPYADPACPDYVEMYTYADLDALIELHGHLRAVNPNNKVTFITASALTQDSLTTHLVLLGGVDWNIVTRDLLDRLNVPVHQGRREVEPAGYFEVAGAEHPHRFAPTIDRSDDKETLLEDVAHFFRGPNPLNRKRTLTMCNGTFARGVLGAVRALTDTRFRDRNEVYLRERFHDQSSFSILFRVPIVNGKGATPDWSDEDIRLHEWSEVTG